MSCLPALGAESFGALGGWVGINFFFSDLACGVTALKPCTQTGVCGACARSLGALGTGVRPPAGNALSLPRSIFCGWLFILSFYVVRAAYNITYDRYFSQPVTLVAQFFFRPPDKVPWRSVLVIIGDCACICSCGACFHIFSCIPCHDGA